MNPKRHVEHPNHLAKVTRYYDSYDDEVEVETTFLRHFLAQAIPDGVAVRSPLLRICGNAGNI